MSPNPEYSPAGLRKPHHNIPILLVDGEGSRRHRWANRVANQWVLPYNWRFGKLYEKGILYPQFMMTSGSLHDFILQNFRLKLS